VIERPPTPSSITAGAANPLWDYSLRLYAVAGVAECCIALQDHHAANVNLLLLCCWSGQSGVALNDIALCSALEAIADWEDRAVQPLRQRRRSLDPSVPQNAAERKRLLVSELRAERHQQDLLYAWFCAAKQGGARSSRQTIIANLNSYALLLAATKGAFTPLLDAALATARSPSLCRDSGMG
jgi:uncharacterized protein (TIGR02444 family)